MSLRQHIYRLGSEPKLSLRRFLTGLVLFAVGASLIALGYYGHYAWQIVGLIVLLPALFFAAWGYLGIFANRFSQIIAATDPSALLDDKDKTN